LKASLRDGDTHRLSPCWFEEAQVKPKRRLAEVLAVAEAILGLFFIAVFGAKAVSRLGLTR
jgi:hypothetical protein